MNTLMKLKNVSKWHREEEEGHSAWR